MQYACMGSISRSTLYSMYDCALPLPQSIFTRIKLALLYKAYHQGNL